MLRSIRTDTVSVVYFIAFSALVIGIPWSRFLMSVSQFMLSALFLWDGISGSVLTGMFRGKPFYNSLSSAFKYLLNCTWANFLSKFQLIFRNTPAMVIISLYVLHVISLIYTSDYQEYFEDLRIKLPLFILPLIIFTTKKFSRHFFYGILIIYIFAVFTVSIFSTGKLLFANISDLREITRISHIRFSLNVCLAVFSSLYLIRNLRKGEFVKIKFLKTSLVTTGIWLVIFLFILKSLNGIVIFLMVSCILLILQLFKREPLRAKLSIISILLISVLSGFLYIQKTVRAYNNVSQVNFNELDSLTSRGNVYYHDTINFPIENGSYTGLYIAKDELKESWNNRSSYDFEGHDAKGQFIKYTIIRFLNSLGYRKDADGVNKLSDEQVHSIEQGIANINFSKSNIIKIRINEILWGINNYKCNKDPNGSSIMQRYEYWKISCAVIKKHYIIGVGSGDLEDVFNEQFISSQSKLLPKWWQRSHNQFLRITAAFGIIGLLWFLFSLFYPPIKIKKFHCFLYLVFFLIAVFSMFTEDTLETQAGVTFFAFFNSFFLAYLEKYADS